MKKRDNFMMMIMESIIIVSVMIIVIVIVIIIQKKEGETGSTLSILIIIKKNINLFLILKKKHVNWQKVETDYFEGSKIFKSGAHRVAFIVFDDDSVLHSRYNDDKNKSNDVYIYDYEYPEIFIPKIRLESFNYKNPSDFIHKLEQNLKRGQHLEVGDNAPRDLFKYLTNIDGESLYFKDSIKDRETRRNLVEAKEGEKEIEKKEEEENEMEEDFNMIQNLFYNMGVGVEYLHVNKHIQANEFYFSKLFKAPWKTEIHDASYFLYEFWHRKLFVFIFIVIGLTCVSCFVIKKCRREKSLREERTQFLRRSESEEEYEHNNYSSRVLDNNMGSIGGDGFVHDEFSYNENFRVGGGNVRQIVYEKPLNEKSKKSKKQRGYRVHEDALLSDEDENDEHDDDEEEKEDGNRELNENEIEEGKEKGEIGYQDVDDENQMYTSKYESSTMFQHPSV